MRNIWVNGTFDIVHLGHLKLLEYAKGLGDVLHVGLDSDERVRSLKGQDRPINSLAQRMNTMKAIKFVDKVYSFASDQELIELIKSISPEALVVGEEYRDKKVIGGEYAKSIVYFPRIGNFSTTNILLKSRNIERKIL
jgi:D-beta-D-heptose 7-phosphate kinase/D-beta-D-heptose 1-phosphate adenosyltransferase